MDEEVASVEHRGSNITEEASKEGGEKDKTRSAVWNEFTKVPATATQKLKGKCNHCGRIGSGRVSGHLISGHIGSGRVGFRVM